jgi:hypothetical protein
MTILFLRLPLPMMIPISWPLVGPMVPYWASDGRVISSIEAQMRMTERLSMHQNTHVKTPYDHCPVS